MAKYTTEITEKVMDKLLERLEWFEKKYNMETGDFIEFEKTDMSEVDVFEWNHTVDTIAEVFDD